MQLSQRGLKGNYYLSPRISAKIMEISGGVAFGAALAGGANAAPMGASIKNDGRRYALAYDNVGAGEVDEMLLQVDRASGAAEGEERREG